MRTLNIFKKLKISGGNNSQIKKMRIKAIHSEQWGLGTQVHKMAAATDLQSNLGPSMWEF